MGISIALRAFFSALSSRDVARRIEDVLEGVRNAPLETEDSPAATASENSKNASTSLKFSATSRDDSRSEALELLAALQRDARFIDFVKEDVAGCDDATLAAAARTTHDRCAETLERFFKIRPLSDVPEGETTSIDLAAQNPARIRVAGSPPTVSGTNVACRVVHAGWIAEKCEPPLWSGKIEDAFVLAPVELEVERF